MLTKKNLRKSVLMSTVAQEGIQSTGRGGRGKSRRVNIC
jgi:hypothetical protein